LKLTAIISLLSGGLLITMKLFEQQSHGLKRSPPEGYLVHMLKLKLKLIYDRRSVGQSVLVTRFLFSVWRLQVSWCVAPSLTRGWVCNVLVELLLGLARAVTLGSKSRRTQTIFYLRLPQPGGPGPRTYIPQEQGGPDIPPGTVFPLRHLLRPAGMRWRYSNPPPHGEEWELSTISYIGIQFVPYRNHITSS
jgi:hypothetical protein